MLCKCNSPDCNDHLHHLKWPQSENRTRLTLIFTTSTDENNQAIVPTKKPRKSDAPVEPSNSSLGGKGKEKGTKPQFWQEVKLDREDEVKYVIAF